MRKTLILFLSVFFLLPDYSDALEPYEVLVVANRNASKSVFLAKYYMKQRGIPDNNLIMLWMTDKEICSREDYDKKAANQIRNYIEENKLEKIIRCLVIMYGVPLKVRPQKMTFKEKNELIKLEKKKKELERQLKLITNNQEDIKDEVEKIKDKILLLNKNNQLSSFDSEIALIFTSDYPLSGWVLNPYYLGFKNKKLELHKENVLMVSRLDGPSDKIVKRIIDDSIEVEKTGLKGTAYFDARWPAPENNKKLNSYAFYDRSIHLAAKRVKENKLNVVSDDKEELFKYGQCPDAALYCGWYSLARYVDAFKWQRGSVGYHIASSECTTLKKKNSQVWCKVMLEKGISATIGPIGEPYVNAFPVPEIFFGYLVDGYLSLAECYIISTPYLSWKMVLIGDPLYRPYKKK
ncbi:TIGR03790 family protein [Candidatus Magnetomoraceae bacterium gMMP-15]